MKQVIIYTDGSSLGNPGAGGWGAILCFSGKEKEISGNQKDATNNQMELMAAIKALEALNEPCTIELFTDSQYVKNGITKWIHGWLKNNWKSASKKPVKNQELWQTLHDLSNMHTVTWKWVKAHNGDELNERADDLARSAAEKLNR